MVGIDGRSNLAYIGAQQIHNARESTDVATEDDFEESGRGSAPIDTALDPREWEGKKPRASTTGTFKPITVQDNWRKKLLAHRVKFDDRAKAVYLAELERTGMKGQAARAAGVTPETVQRHIKEVDPDFAEAAEEAFQGYCDRIAGKIVQEAVDGVLVTKSRRVLGDDGETFEEEIHREVKFETALRARILARVDPAYRENSNVNLSGNVTGGVLLIPVVKDLSEWEALFGADAIDDDPEASGELIEMEPTLA